MGSSICGKSFVAHTSQKLLCQRSQSRWDGGREGLPQVSVTNTKETQAGQSRWKSRSGKEDKNISTATNPLALETPSYRLAQFTEELRNQHQSFCILDKQSPIHTSFINRQLVTFALYFSIFCLISWMVGGSGFSSSTVCVTFWNQKRQALAVLRIG